MTVVETERFLKDTRSLMPESERVKLVAFVAANPRAGDLIPETGGVRKLRRALAGRGKRGGARVIYYFHSEQLPVFLLAAYGKNEKANRPQRAGRRPQCSQERPCESATQAPFAGVYWKSKAERNAMAKLIPMLVEGYPGKPGRKA